MAEIVKKVQWAETLKSIEVGSSKTFGKAHFAHVSNVRNTATRLKKFGTWSVSENKQECTFTVTRTA